MVEITERMIESGANAIMQLQTERAREAIDAFDFDASSVVDISKKLLKESETAQILIFYSYLDDQILQLIKLHLHHLDNNQTKDRLFGISGPLSSFGSRILLAYHLGWITTEHKMRLDAFRSVRNEFAHRAFKIDITDPAIAKLLSKFDMDIRKMLSGWLSPAELEGGNPNKLLCKLIILALGVFRELIVFPVAMQMHVSPHLIIGNFDEQPKLIRQLELTMSEALLTAAGIHSTV